LLIYIYPHANINLPTCALIGMAAMFAGASRALLTSIVFAFESTMEPHGILPLLGACIAAYFVSFFLMKHGTIMTEKINRRGVHTPDAFEPDILQKLSVSTVMEDDDAVVSVENCLGEVQNWISKSAEDMKPPEAIAAVDENENLLGIIVVKDILNAPLPADTPINQFIKKQQVYVYSKSPLSFAVDLMDRFHADYLPVMDKEDKKIVGILTYKNIFAAYRNRKNEERLYNRNIFMRRQGYRLIVKGKQLFK